MARGDGRVAPGQSIIFSSVELGAFASEVGRYADSAVGHRADWLVSAIAKAASALASEEVAVALVANEDKP